MYLKSLELHGFKSFPEKTVLQFHDGATVIVGPNGSGKSNITDAMRWVLGELSTKNIRGSKMEDVVFAGADGKKPMSFAEVSVTFDDSESPKVLAAEYDEVTVTRRYYRSGDSEYFINRKRARLKDIYELFMNTGIGREGYSPRKAKNAVPPLKKAPGSANTGTGKPNPKRSWRKPQPIWSGLPISKGNWRQE